MDFYDLFAPKAPEQALGGTPNVTPGTATSYAAAALRKEAETVASTGEGSRNHALNLAAFRMGRHVGAGNIDAETVRTTLAAAARAAGLPEHEIDTVLRDAPNSGINQGTTVPRHPAPQAPLPAVTTLTTPTAAQDDPAADPAETFFPILDWHELWATEDDEEWIIEPLLPARRSVALYSAPKVGKSLLMLEIAAGIAQGTEVLGVTPDRPYRVLYVDFENDPRGDVRSRLQAMEIGPDQLANLCYMSFPTLAKLDTAMGGIQLVATAQHYECEVVVIDTVSRAVEGEENANDTWLGFYRNTGLHLKALGIACIRLDHTGKDRSKGMRGGSAKYGDVDAVWKLEMTSETTLTLECTDHRMTIPQNILALNRESFPLRHTVVGTHWSDVLDSQAAAIDRDLDDLGLPASASVRDCGTALRQAGRTVRQEVLTRAVKARKVRLDIVKERGSA